MEKQEEMVFWVCPKCMHCGATQFMEVEMSRYDRWKGGELIQDAFDNLSPAEREMLKSGIHPKCWKEIFG